MKFLFAYNYGHLWDLLIYLFIYLFIYLIMLLVHGYLLNTPPDDTICNGKWETNQQNDYESLNFAIFQTAPAFIEVIQIVISHQNPLTLVSH